MNKDKDIQRMIQDAENQVPPKDLSVTVIREACSDVQDVDHQQYKLIYAALPSEKRKALAHDFNAYLYLHPFMRDLTIQAQICLTNIPQEIQPGPFLKRVCRPASRPPRHWRVCSYCSGTGKDETIAHCNNCGGNGYLV
jgi:hypothetical protein